MKIIGTQKISEKLVWLQILVVVGLLLVGITFLAVGKIEDRATNQTKKLTDFAFLAEQAEADLLQSRRREKDFLMHFGKKYLDRFEEQFNTLSDKLQQLKRSAPNESTLKLVNLSEELALQYKATFEKTAQVQIRLGLDKTKGLYGNMRKAVRAISKEIGAQRNLALENSLLMMRQHEKDFILRKDLKYLNRMNEENKGFSALLSKTALSNVKKRKINDLMGTYQRNFTAFVDSTIEVKESVAIYTETAHQAEPLFDKMVLTATGLLSENDKKTEALTKFVFTAFFLILLLVAVITIYVLFNTSKNLAYSLSQLGTTVNKLSSGDYSARALLDTTDELGLFGGAFDDLLDERVTTLAQAEQDNERLNNSVVDLMEAVSKLSDRDLTVHVSVAEDVTGPVADAMNMMTTETARVLNDIREVASEVEIAANAVKEQGNKVSSVAAEERTIVEQTLNKLDETATTMNQIAKVAQSCNTIADKASASTQEALQTVNTTAEGMNDVRSTISEAEKRIKRLGERSQEITSIVEIINNIAERTHVLALNASMQAAAAGDAGRGFAVVADEVQRLAESSRQSTSEIGALVNNIQNETAEAMFTMNRTIEQVVAGTELAQKSGIQMQTTQKNTTELASVVNSIAKHSIAQARATTALRQEATSIADSTKRTGSELMEQSKQTKSLVDFSQRLLASVGVFKLPA